MFAKQSTKYVTSIIPNTAMITPKIKELSIAKVTKSVYFAITLLIICNWCSFNFVTTDFDMEIDNAGKLVGVGETGTDCSCFGSCS